jgi:hypothetical protein
LAQVTVTPDTFTFVLFDAGEIAATVGKLADQLGLGDAPITLEVDETIPLGGTEIRSVDPIHIFMESGAIEDAKKPRKFSDETAAPTIGRLLLRVRDRRGPFADAPADTNLTLLQHAAWDAYCMGRLERLGYKSQRQRRLYAFRTRHGFSDTADEVFARLWGADDLTWADLDALSQAAAGVAA